MKITTALQFSGGKDSRAILHIYKDQLKEILVVWANTGAAYPEVEREMAQMARKVPNFLIVRGNQPKQVEKNGYPSDVVPINYTPFGRAMVKSAEKFKIQSAFDCCAANMWTPLHTAMTMLGIKRIIRGQRRSETYTNYATTNGAVVGGIEFVLPIEDWTDEQVFDYLKKNSVEIPAYYQSENTSHDCWNCTAYLKSYTSRIKNLDPGPRAEVNRRLAEIQAAINLESAPIATLLEETK